MKSKTIYFLDDHRILECVDNDFSWDLLKGDMFKPECAPNWDIDELKQLEVDFEDKVNREGVYGYVLEKWNPAVGVGWEEVNACWGFVGRHADEKHYIVDEYIKDILWVE